MLREKLRQRSTQRRIFIALILLLLMICAVNVQFFLESNVVSRIVANTNKMQRQKNLFIGYYGRV